MNCKKCGRRTVDCQACKGGRVRGLGGYSCSKCGQKGQVSPNCGKL